MVQTFFISAYPKEGMISLHNYLVSYPDVLAP